MSTSLRPCGPRVGKNYNDWVITYDEEDYPTMYWSGTLWTTKRREAKVYQNRPEAEPTWKELKATVAADYLRRNKVRIVRIG